MFKILIFMEDSYFEVLRFRRGFDRYLFFVCADEVAYNFSSYVMYNLGVGIYNLGKVYC